MLYFQSLGMYVGDQMREKLICYVENVYINRDSDIIFYIDNIWLVMFKGLWCNCFFKIKFLFFLAEMYTPAFLLSSLYDSMVYSSIYF